MNRIASLTGLRGIAAYSVLLAHMINADFKGLTDIAFAVRLDHFAMSLFFVLSGFVIHYNYVDRIKDRHGLFDFFVSRFARLYPLYLIVTVIYITVLQGTPHPAVLTPLVIVSYATLTQSWINTQDAIFTATWSISTEWFFYIGFSLLVMGGVLSKTNHVTRVTIAFIFASASILLLFFAICGLFPLTPAPMFDHGLASAPEWYWLTHLSPWIRIFEFGVGILTSMAYRAGPIRISHYAGFAAIGWCLLIVLVGIDDNHIAADFLSNFIFAPALAIILLYGSDQENLVARLLSSPPMLLAGEISYSVYLLQFICHMLSRHFIDLAALDVCMSVVLTTVVAFLSYRLFEVPARRLIRDAARRYLSLRKSRRAIA